MWVFMYVHPHTCTCATTSCALKHRSCWFPQIGMGFPVGAGCPPRALRTLLGSLYLTFWAAGCQGFGNRWVYIWASYCALRCTAHRGLHRHRWHGDVFFKLPAAGSPCCKSNTFKVKQSGSHSALSWHKSNLGELLFLSHLPLLGPLGMCCRNNTQQLEEWVMWICSHLLSH